MEGKVIMGRSITTDEKKSARWRVLNVIRIPVILFLIFYGSLVIVYCIPSGAMVKNVSKSYDIISREGLYPRAYMDGHRYDNFTVTLMLNMALNTTKSPFIAAIQSSYSSGEDQIDGLRRAISGEDGDIPYPRYWHGYLIFLKPALVFLNIYQIRLLCQTIALLLLMIISIELKGQFGKFGVWVAAALALSWGIYSGMSASATLPLFSSFVISLFAGIYILKFYRLRRESECMKLFFVIGAVTVFFDFLDNPVLTLGVPLCVLILKMFFVGEDKLKKHSIVSALICCASWGGGYGIMWGSKWLLFFLISGPSALNDVKNAAKFRLGRGEDAARYGSTPSSAILKNLMEAGKFRIMILAEIAIICVVFAIILMSLLIRLKRVKAERLIISVCFELGIVSLFPFAWYAVLNNHSQVHADIIAFRNLMLTMFAGLLLLGLLFDCIKKELKNGSYCGSSPLL